MSVTLFNLDTRPESMRNEETERTQAPLQEERALWLAVLVQAVRDLTGVNRDAHKQYHRSLQYFAYLWFESDSSDPGSFEWICDQLDLDASWFRRRLFFDSREPRWRSPSKVRFHTTLTQITASSLLER